MEVVCIFLVILYIYCKLLIVGFKAPLLTSLTYGGSFQFLGDIDEKIIALILQDDRILDGLLGLVLLERSGFLLFVVFFKS